MNMNFTKFPVPVLGDETQILYSKLYGEAGGRFVDILNTSPNEIAVISGLIAYLKEKRGGKQYGHKENSRGDRTV